MRPITSILIAAVLLSVSLAVLGAYVVPHDSDTSLANATDIIDRFYDPQVAYMRYGCAICTKTVWEKVEHDLNDYMVDITDSTIIWEWPEEPEREEVEYLSHKKDIAVCRHCKNTYATDFRARMEKTANGFLQEAQAASAERRKQVTQENTQEELRRLQAQVDTYIRELQKLTEKMEQMKATMERTEE